MIKKAMFYFKKKRFALKSKKSPSYYNLGFYLQQLGWRYTPFYWLAAFSEKNFQFDNLTTQCLEYKHLLGQLVAKYCPQVMPLTYILNDNNWVSILNNIVANKYYAQDNFYKDQPIGYVWILKPSMLNNGQDIKIFTKLSDLERHLLSAQRVGGEHVLQQYITEPHLIGKSKHKYSIRMFVVLTNYAGCYLYPHGYFNVAIKPFNVHDFSDLGVHITNEHLYENANNVIQIPTERFGYFNLFYEQIKFIVSAVLVGLKTEHPLSFQEINRRKLAIFGFDFIVDHDQRLWLIEANHGPCFPIEQNHPLQKYLYNNFWRNFVHSFVLPIAECQIPARIKYQLFEKI